MLEFANPTAFWWALLALPIIGFYILKVRLRRVPATTLLFWNQLYDEKKPRSWWQRFRHWLSLLLQLAFLFLLVAALVDPLWSWQKQQRRNIVLIIDNSASMQAVEEDGQSRLQLAKEAGQALVRSLRDGDQMALISAGGTPRVVWGMTNHSRWLSQAIGDLPETDAPNRIQAAVSLAQRLLANLEGKPETIVITDGCAEDLDELAKADTVALYGVGTPQDNLGITRYQVRRSLLDTVGYQVLIDVTNHSEDASECRIELELEGELVDVLPLNLQPGETATRIINHTSPGGGRMLARLDVEDALAVDNQAVAVLPARKPIPIVFSGEDNLFVSSVLRSIPLVQLSAHQLQPPTDSPDADLFPSEAADPKDIPDDMGIAATPVSLKASKIPPPAIQVYYKLVPKQIPPGRVLVIDPRNDCDAWQLGDAIEDPIVAEVDQDSPLTQHVRLENVLFSGARQMDFTAEAEVLARDPLERPLLARVRRPGGDLVVLTCDLATGDLPLRIAFPVLMKNTIEWFAGDSGELQPAVASGEVLSLDLEQVAASLNTATDMTTSAAAMTTETPENETQADSRQSTPGLVLTGAVRTRPARPWQLISPAKNTVPIAASDGRAIIGPLLQTGVYRLDQLARDAQGTHGEADSEPSPSQSQSETKAKAIEDNSANKGVADNRETPTAGSNATATSVGYRIACNLVSSEESNLTPRQDLPSVQDSGILLLGGRSLWFYLTLAAAGLIAVEWWLYQRRIVG